jgi:hypothetical protein
LAMSPTPALGAPIEFTLKASDLSPRLAATWTMCGRCRPCATAPRSARCRHSGTARMKRLPAKSQLLPDGKRLHLQDGPIDLIVRRGTAAMSRAAYEAAARRFTGCSTSSARS